MYRRNFVCGDVLLNKDRPSPRRRPILRGWSDRARATSSAVAKRIALFVDSLRQTNRAIQIIFHNYLFISTDTRRRLCDGLTTQFGVRSFLQIGKFFRIRVQPIPNRLHQFMRARVRGWGRFTFSTLFTNSVWWIFFNSRHFCTSSVKANISRPVEEKRRCVTVEKSREFEHIHIHVLDQFEISRIARLVAGGNQTFQSEFESENEGWDECSAHLVTTLLNKVLKLFTLNAKRTLDANCRTCWTVIPSPGTLRSYVIQTVLPFIHSFRSFSSYFTNDR